MEKIKFKDARHEDHYFPDPGTVESAECGLCGTEMDVKRNVFGPTQWTMAISGSGRKHDCFSCRYSKEDWHQRLRSLRHLASETPSDTLKAIYENDAKVVMKAGLKLGKAPKPTPLPVSTPKAVRSRGRR